MGLLSKLFGGGNGGKMVTASTAVRLCGSGRQSVVGESHYQPALKKAAGGKKSSGWKDAIPVEVVLAPEPTNRYDRNAVQVLVDGQLVGYLPAEAAAAYQPVLMEMLQRGEFGWCTGAITGGGRGRSYGIFLNLAGHMRLTFANSPEGLELVEGDRMVTVSGFDDAAIDGMHADDRGLLPPLAGSLSLGRITKGKYEGQPCIDVSVDGRRAGSFTAKMSERYLPMVEPVLASGRTPGCELMVRQEGDSVKAWAMMPRA